MQEIAYSYARVSGKGQVEGDGEERQLSAIRTFCTTNGLSLRAHAFEAGVSGTIEALDRKAFSELLETIEEHRHQHVSTTGSVCGFQPVIIVERMDRLARDLMVQEFLLRECRERKIKIYATDQEKVDLAANDIDPTRKLIRQVLGALAEWEKSALVKKLNVARKRKAASTGRCEGAKPFGFYEAEKKTHQVLKDLRAAGHSYSDIAKMLNAHGGYPPRFAKYWTRQRVTDVCEYSKNNSNTERTEICEAVDLTTPQTSQ